MRLRFLAVPVLAAAALAACSPRDKPPSAPPQASGSPPAVASPATDRASAQRDAVVAYVGMWRAYETAAAAGDTSGTQAARYATGDALDLINRAVQKIVKDGLRAQGTSVLAPRATEVRGVDVPAEVRVDDCMDTSGTRLVKVDGSKYTDSPGGRRKMVATVRLVDGGWKVVSFGLGQVGTC
ncbi:hypothetical protein [Catellatospora paridis]|uniref:hypothetical protein n=1 Tax=Catellatospora paridis TaxID=1617086 RepID=UPI0012D48C09|nr:hypothetical protein [Catellatospora paridis]